jgi:hypothetical protein
VLKVVSFKKLSKKVGQDEDVKLFPRFVSNAWGRPVGIPEVDKDSELVAAKNDEEGPVIESGKLEDVEEASVVAKVVAEAAAVGEKLLDKVLVADSTDDRRRRSAGSTTLPKACSKVSSELGTASADEFDINKKITANRMSHAVRLDEALVNCLVAVDILAL